LPPLLRAQYFIVFTFPPRVFLDNSCDCDEDVRWATAVKELTRHPAWVGELKGKFVFGFARRAGIERFQLLDNFAVEGAPALGIDNIPVG
jgi:hypothetical protein